VLCDKLEHLKQSRAVVKLTYSHLPQTSEIEPLRRLPAVVSLAQEGRSVRLVTHGDVEGLTQALRVHASAPREVEVVDLTLEDLFLEYVKEESHDRQGTH
jgi:hypothetical protein